MVADKGLLVEHRPVAAEEAVLGGAGHDAIVVLDGQADVEDLGTQDEMEYLVSGILNLCNIWNWEFQAADLKKK